jgi:very-short-patch-repair endonuclease
LQDHARDALIRHQGWKVVRIPAWRCLSNPDRAVEEIRSVLEDGVATAI